MRDLSIRNVDLYQVVIKCRVMLDGPGTYTGEWPESGPIPGSEHASKSICRHGNGSRGANRAPSRAIAQQGDTGRAGRLRHGHDTRGAGGDSRDNACGRPSSAIGAPAGNKAGKISLLKATTAPVTGAAADGTTFTGNFDLKRFKERGGVLYAVGTLTGTMDGKSYKHNVSLPVTNGSNESAATTAAAAQAQQVGPTPTPGACSILTLNLGRAEPQHSRSAGCVGPGQSAD